MLWRIVFQKKRYKQTGNEERIYKVYSFFSLSLNVMGFGALQ
jgi:hypothetical protein